MSDYDIKDLDPRLAGWLLSNPPEKKVDVYITIKLGALIMLWPFVTDFEPTQEFDRNARLTSRQLHHLAREMRQAMRERQAMINWRRPKA